MALIVVLISKCRWGGNIKQIKKTVSSDAQLVLKVVMTTSVIFIEYLEFSNYFLKSFVYMGGVKA